MGPWQLIAREEIRELVAAYAHLADTGRFAELVGLFAPDGALHAGDTPELQGRDAILAFLSGTTEGLRRATSAALIRHHVSNLRIDLAGPDEASGASYFLVLTTRGLDHWGRYRDRYTRVDGRWYFRHRRARLDGFSPDSWSAKRRSADQPSSAANPARDTQR